MDETSRVDSGRSALRPTGHRLWRCSLRHSRTKSGTGSACAVTNDSSRSRLSPFGPLLSAMFAPASCLRSRLDRLDSRRAGPPRRARRVSPMDGTNIFLCTRPRAPTKQPRKGLLRIWRRDEVRPRAVRGGRSGRRPRCRSRGARSLASQSLDCARCNICLACASVSLVISMPPSMRAISSRRDLSSRRSMRVSVSSPLADLLT